MARYQRKKKNHASNCDNGDDGVMVTPLPDPLAPRESREPTCATFTGTTFGAGAQGSVKAGKVTLPDGDIPVAIKTYPANDAQEVKAFNNEFTALERLNGVSEHIERLIGYDKATRTLALEALPGGDLKTAMQNKRPADRVGDRAPAEKVKDTAKAVRQMVQAVSHMHKMKVVHRDIKIEQFVYERSPLVIDTTCGCGILNLYCRRKCSQKPNGGDITAVDLTTPMKLVDFGLAMVQMLDGKTWVSMIDAADNAGEKVESEGETGMAQWKWDSGTPQLMAPELFKESPEPFSVFAPDIWALGMEAAELLGGELLTMRYVETNCQDAEGSTPLPWEDTFGACIAKMTQAMITTVVEQFIGDEHELARDFILKALQVDPNERETAAKLLSHDWLHPLTA